MSMCFLFLGTLPGSDNEELKKNPLVALLGGEE